MNGQAAHQGGEEDVVPDAAVEAGKRCQRSGTKGVEWNAQIDHVGRGDQGIIEWLPLVGLIFEQVVFDVLNGEGVWEDHHVCFPSEGDGKVSEGRGEEG